MHQQPRVTEQPFALKIASRSPKRDRVSGWTTRLIGVSLTASRSAVRHDRIIRRGMIARAHRVAKQYPGGRMRLSLPVLCLTVLASAASAAEPAPNVTELMVGAPPPPSELVTRENYI